MLKGIGPSIDPWGTPNRLKHGSKHRGRVAGFTVREAQPSWHGCVMGYTVG